MPGLVTRPIIRSKRCSCSLQKVSGMCTAFNAQMPSEPRSGVGRHIYVLLDALGRLQVSTEYHILSTHALRQRPATLRLCAGKPCQPPATTRRTASPSPLYEGYGLTRWRRWRVAPVACSNRTSFPEVEGEAGLLVDPADTRALNTAILAVLRTPSGGVQTAQRGPAAGDKMSLGPHSVRNPHGV
jgi:hypothetical protein